MSRRPGDQIQKDPASIEPQGVDWTDYLAELSTTISSSTYAVSPSGLTLSGATIAAGNLKTQVTLSGGTLGIKYTVTNQIMTATGVTDERSFDVLVEDR